MNKFQASRFINNYIANLELNDLLINEIKKYLQDHMLNLKEIEKTDIATKILELHMKELDKDILSYIDKTKFRAQLVKKYCATFAQDEIVNNMNTSIGEQANNLSFSSQDVDFRAAPIVVCREFLSPDCKEYKDHVFA